MAVILESLATLSVFVFVVTSMLSMGLKLTVGEIIEPLRDRMLVVKTLVANFLLVSLAAYVILLVIPLTEPQAIGLVLLAIAAGPPFLPKLAEIAKANEAFSVGLMVLLVVATIVYVPIVLPLILPGAQASPLDVAGSLVVLLFVPLAVGLFVRARYADTAAHFQPIVTQVSSTALVFLIVLALGSAQRNGSAALVVAGANFDDPEILIMLVVGVALAGLLIVTAGELGRRAGRTSVETEPGTTTERPQ